MNYVDNIVVYRIVGSSKQYLELLKDPIDVQIELDIKDDDKKLNFSITNDYQVREEDYLRCFDQEWVVKEVNRTTLVTSIVATQNIEKLAHTPVSSIRTESLTLSETLAAFFASLDTLDYGGNWTYQLASDITGDVELVTRRRTTDLRRVMALDVIKDIANTWFLEVEFDTFNKIIRFYKQRGEDKGTYFTSQLNLRKIAVESDTYDFVTKIIPLGKDDLNIMSINGGSPSVENFEYSDKVLTKYWIDNRYTDPIHLKQDAIQKLEELAKPLKTYNCDIIDLSSSTHPALSYGLGDTVTIIDEHLGIRDVQRIVKMTKIPYNPEENRAQLANRKESFDELQNKLIDTREIINNTYSPSGRIIFNEVEALPEFKQTIEEDVNSLTITIQTLQETVDEIDVDAYTITLGNESQTIPVDETYRIVGNVDFGTSISALLGVTRVPAFIGDVRFYSSGDVPIDTMTIDYNENNIHNSDFSEATLPNFDGDNQSVDTIVTIDGEYASMASSGVTGGEFFIGLNADTSTYFVDPELPFQAGKAITFSAYLKTGARPLESAWVVSTAYLEGQMVSHDGQNHICRIPHTAVDFYNDLAEEKWEKIAYAYIAIHEWVDEGGIITKTTYPSQGLGINEEGLLVTNITNHDNATNVALSIVSDYGVTNQVLQFKEPKLEEGMTATTFTPLLDILNNFEIKAPSELEDGFVTTTLIEGTHVPYNVGYLSIPIIIEGATFFKRISFTRAMTSENDIFIEIIPTTQIMASQDGGATFEPDWVRLYPDLRNLTYIKWQYSYDGYNFIDLPAYLGTLITTSAVWDALSDVLVVPEPPIYPDPHVYSDTEFDPFAIRIEDVDGFDNTLYLSANSSLFLKAVGDQTFLINSLVFRLIAEDVNGTAYTDTISLSRVYDSREALRTMESTVRTDIESINESVREFRDDLYYYDEEVGRYILYTSDYSQFKQDVDHFMLTVQDGGGANLLKDSVGVNYPASGAWTLVSGNVAHGVSTSWGLSFIAKHSWFIQTGQIKQEFTIRPQTEYTFSCAFKKPISGDVTFALKASTWDTPQTMFSKPAGEEYEGAQSFTFLSGANTRFEIIITVSGATSDVEITDVMMSLGKISSWQQSNGELFATNVIIDATGIKVNDVNGNGYTVISPYEFAGYYDNQRIFTLNGTKTIVQELVAAGGGIYVAPVKLIQVEGATPRAAFVWTGPAGE